MKLTSLNHLRLRLHLNQDQLPSHQATTITVKMIYKQSNTRLYHGSTPASNRSCKVQCENTLQGSHLAAPMEEFHRESWQPIEGVVRCSANYIPLSPITFLERASDVYKKQTSVVYGSIKYTWEETHHRCTKLASALNHLGVSRGDVIAILAPNIPAMLELHFAIPMAGAIICPLNTRLDPKLLSNFLKHSEAKILFVDYQLLQIAKEAVNLLKNTLSESPLLVIISEPNYRSPFKHTRKYDYETLVEGGSAEFSIVRPYNECDPISLNYISGTTSRPKGIFYSHRGAYLNSLASVFIHGIREMSTYLWSQPMFQFNGWCFSWGVAVIGCTNVFLRCLNPEDIFDNIVIYKVTHMCGVLTVLNMIANFFMTNQKHLPHTVEIKTSGAPVPSNILSKMEERGFRVSHIYEIYISGTCSFWKPEWDLLPLEV